MVCYYCVAAAAIVVRPSTVLLCASRESNVILIVLYPFLRRLPSARSALLLEQPIKINTHSRPTPLIVCYKQHDTLCCCYKPSSKVLNAPHTQRPTASVYRKFYRYKLPVWQCIYTISPLPPRLVGTAHSVITCFLNMVSLLCSKLIDQHSSSSTH